MFITTYFDYVTILNIIVQDMLFMCPDNSIFIKMKVTKAVRYYAYTTNVMFGTKITISTLTKKISRNDRVRNEVLQRFKGIINIPHTMKACAR